MAELLYDIHIGLIAVGLFVSMGLTIELGHGIGRKQRVHDVSKEHINGILAAVLGILALMLAFTLSESLQRFDSRSEAVVEEANAIGTAWLRAQLLEASPRAEAQARLRDYVELRVRSGGLSQADPERRAPVLKEAERLQSALWTGARSALENQPTHHPPMLYVQSINEMLDAYARRESGINRHVPELVLLLLFLSLLLAGTSIGYAAGFDRHRPTLASYVMAVLIVALVFVILDLDRPRRGLIQVSQESLLNLQKAIGSASGTPGAKAGGS